MLLAWALPFSASLCSQLLSVPLCLRASPPRPNRAPKKGWLRNRSPHVKILYMHPFFLFGPIKKKRQILSGFVCLPFPTSRNFFFSQRNPFLGRSPSLSPNVIWFQAFGILMRNYWVLIAQRVKCCSHHQYRASSRPQEISLPKSKTARLPSREREGEGLWLVITDEQIIKSTSLLILLFFKIKKSSTKHFQVDPSDRGNPQKA